MFGKKLFVWGRKKEEDWKDIEEINAEIKAEEELKRVEEDVNKAVEEEEDKEEAKEGEEGT